MKRKWMVESPDGRRRQQQQQLSFGESRNENAADEDRAAFSSCCGGGRFLMARPTAAAASTSFCCRPSSDWLSADRDTLTDGSSTNKNNSSASTPNATTNKDTTTDAESLLVQEMNELTVQERQEAYEDVHGVREPIAETPDLVQQALQDFDVALQSMRKTKKYPAYDKADILLPARTRDAQWRLQFLRVDDMDAKAAVHRMLLYYETIADYFGLECTLRDLQWSDLTPDEISWLKLGGMQPLLDTTDRSGRPICAFFVSHAPYQDYRSVLRACWVMYMKLFPHPVAQRLGFVLICYETGIRGTSNSSFQWSEIQSTMQCYNAMPRKLSAVHYCYNDPNIRPLMEYVKLVIGKRGRVRFRPHFGSDTEVKYHLMGFGIDSSRLPVDHEGRMQTASFCKWLDDQRTLEHRQQQQQQVETKQSVLVVPTKEDVLLGKGSFFAQWPGNQRLSQMVADHWDEYQGLSRSGKTELFERLAVEHGGRFLKRSSKDGPWQEISLAQARDKVAHSFRNKVVLEKYHAAKTKKDS